MGLALALWGLWRGRRAASLSREVAALRADETRRRHFAEENDLSSTANQLRFIAAAELRAVSPVNKEARRVLDSLDEWIAEHQPDWRVSFEVAMGAFVRTAYEPRDRMQRAAFRSYNSKRVDFLVVDGGGHPRLVVEYHGTGHDLSGDAAERMSVKRTVLNRVGIPLAEIPAKAERAATWALIDAALSENEAGRGGRSGRAERH